VEPFASDVVNYPALVGDTSGIDSGWDGLGDLIAKRTAGIRRSGGTVLVGADGYAGTDWSRIERLFRGLPNGGFSRIDVYDVRTCELGESEVSRMLRSSLPDDEPVFGRVFEGTLSDFFDGKAVSDLARRLSARKSDTSGSLVFCFGSGALQPGLRDLYDLAFYFDNTREEALKRNREWAAKTGQTQSISPRRIYYVDFPVHDRHRRIVLAKTDYYIDGSNQEDPAYMPTPRLVELVRSLTRMPLRIKPIYEPGVWGGQWLKSNRGLPDSMVNCAYGFEIIAPEQSLIVSVGTVQVELSFNLLMEIDPVGVVGRRVYRRFGREFPIRFAYDDTWHGGNLSVQVHPTTKYMKETFNERIHQAEMYYVFDAEPDAFSHLGLRHGTTAEAFRRAAEESERSRTPFDHRQFVNVVPARKGDILLIPPGTVHGAGANALILEISSTPYRYTFKIYDYCRPNLDGSFRPIHIDHAFNVIKFFRDEQWVDRNLTPEPILFEEGSNGGNRWKRYVIADRREFHHVVHRIEFDGGYTCETNGGFHLLNLVEGDIVRLEPIGAAPVRDGFPRRMAYSETVLVPSGVERYRIINEGTRPCKAVLSYIRR